jgi:hypothetical protein
MTGPSKNASSGEDTRPASAYRDEAHFREVLDEAADRIQSLPRSGQLVNGLFYGLLVFQIAGVLSRVFFKWDFREHIVPGVDLASLLWALLVSVYAIGWLGNRRFHAQIVRKRLCLDCGTPLRRAQLSADGTGQCPQCTRAFSLAEYRHPSANAGREFGGYHDNDHFDKTMSHAADRIRQTGGLRNEGQLLSSLWSGLLILWLGKVLFGWDVVVPIGRMTVGLPAVVLVVLFAWSIVHHFRNASLIERIVTNHMCLDCGYSLMHTPDDVGIGRCPECGGEFNRRQYERPEDEDDES